MTAIPFRLSFLTPLCVLAVGAGLIAQDYAPMAVFAAVALAALMALGAGGGSRDALDWVLLCLVAYCSVHALFIGDTPALASVQAASLMTLGFIAYALRRARAEDAFVVLVFVGLAGAALGAVGLWQAAHGAQPRSLFLDINSQAAFVLSAAAAAAVAAMRVRRPGLMRAALLTAAALAVAGWLAARSKGSSLAVVLVLLLAASSWWPRLRAHRFGVPLFVGAVLAAAAALAFAAHKHGGLAFVWSAQSVQSRLGMWEKTLDMVRGAPLLGHGMAQWQHLYRRDWSPRDADSYGAWAHNDYLQAAAEGGLPLAALLGAAALAALAAVRRRQRCADAGATLLAVAAAVLAVHAATNFIFYNTLLAVTFGALLGTALPVEGGSARGRLPVFIAAFAAAPAIALSAWVGWGDAVGRALLNPASWQAAILRPRLTAQIVEQTPGEASRYLANPYAASAVADVHVLVATAAKARADLKTAAEHSQRVVSLYAAARRMAPSDPTLAHVQAMELLNLQQLGLLPDAEAFAVARAAISELQPLYAGKSLAVDIAARLAFIQGDCLRAVEMLVKQADETRHWAWRGRLRRSALKLAQYCPGP
jgi:O-antigen ligase